MLRQRPSQRKTHGRSDGDSRENKKTTVESDVSVEGDGKSSSDASGNFWLEDTEEPETDSVTSNIHPPKPPKRHIPSRGFPPNGLGGNPLVTVERRGHPIRTQVPPYHQPRRVMDESKEKNVSRGYLHNTIHYHPAPNMQGVPGPQVPISPYGSGGYYNNYAPYNPYINQRTPVKAAETPINRSPPPAPHPTEQTPIPREDPEKIRLEAEIAAFKAMEEKAKLAEKQKENEEYVRKEAEASMFRRVEDMKLAQEEARKQMELTKRELEMAIRENLENKRKTEEIQAKEHAQMIASAEKAALERLRTEKELEEERARELKKFAVDLEKEIRLKVEMQNRADIAEREEKARQSEDIERLAKVKMLQSMDEIADSAKKRVLSDVSKDGDTILLEDRQRWLAKTQSGTEIGKSLSPKESRPNRAKTSMVKQTTVSQRAIASTVHGESDVSVRLSSLSPAPSMTGFPPEVPMAPGLSGSESGSELAPSEDIFNNTHSPRSRQRGRAHQQANEFERPQWDEVNVLGIQEALVDQIADTVVQRLISSSYKCVPTRHRRYTDQSYDANPFAPAPGPYQRDIKSRNEKISGYFPQGPAPRGATGQFHRPYKPDKPDHLRGKILKESDILSSLEPPAHATSSMQQHVGDGGPAISHTTRTPRSSLEIWLENIQRLSDKTPSQRGYSEVETITEEPSTLRKGRLMAGGSDDFLTSQQHILHLKTHRRRKMADLSEFTA
ncbi:hypothetical protein FVEN_g6497 [Fusarium venenatum]|uniref:Uncharacterized protein n=1 Tax=Fusarium venenatum TaxID=56646 RepID=A0A2L2TBL2_9HYPO|nr:uncharacterized protein FVRRES_04772 [Fusarium venenatum]KAG8355594.1 hypothetical protein FVEN_g6497 [Fusarium venenatum]KAH6991922.1 hypothetical protein EDB82DRAFT_494734 [Fusarium venenatum]CEI60336.1 unnamed protein product [Fusarium venenatum]